MKLFQIWMAAIVVCVFVFATNGYADDATAALYKTKCQACHGADGTGNTPAGKKLGVKDIHSPEVVKMSDAELFDITKKGKDKMPSYDKKLTDNQIKDLVKYLRSLK